MNSTEHEQAAAALGALFDEVLMPISAGMREAGLEAFPLKPDVSWLSYYVRRRRSAMTPDDFSTASCAGVGEFEARLAAHWQALGRHQLAAQAVHFGQAARAARAAAGASAVAPELPPYVYAMF